MAAFAILGDICVKLGFGLRRIWQVREAIALARRMAIRAIDGLGSMNAVDGLLQRLQINAQLKRLARGQY